MMRIAMEMAERSRHLGYQIHMLLLDWKKFFDKVEWWLVEATLVHVGVPLRVVRFVETLVATRRCNFVTAPVCLVHLHLNQAWAKGAHLRHCWQFYPSNLWPSTLDAVCQGIHIGASRCEVKRAFLESDHARWLC